MRVSVETTTGLERKATVAVPAESYEAAMAEFLKKRAATLKLPGFRPGKVPMKEVQRRFGTTARAEVTQTLVNASFADVVAEQQLAVVGVPQVEVLNHAAAGNDFEYTATFEVMPTIELQPFEALRVNVPTIEITESDVDGTVELLREQQVEWVEVERPAAEKDRVTVDYVAKVDGETVLEGAEEAVIVGGHHQVVELPAAVVGMTAGETRTFPISLRFREKAEATDEADPDAEDDAGAAIGADAEREGATAETAPPEEAPPAAPGEGEANEQQQAAAGQDDADGHVEDADGDVEDADEYVEDAGGDVDDAADAQGADGDLEGAAAVDDAQGYIEKDGIGEVSLRRVEAPQLPAVDDDFFDKLGIEPGPDRVAEFRLRVRRRMQSELDQAVRRAQRRELASVLRDAYDFDLPDVLVRAELTSRMRRIGLTLDLETVPPELAHLMYQDARDEVRLGLVLTEVARSENIEVDNERLGTRIAELATEFEDPAEAQQALVGNQENLRQVAGAVLEDQTMEHLLARADVTELPCSYADAITGRALPRRPTPPPPSAEMESSSTPPDPTAEAPEAEASEQPGDGADAPAADAPAESRGWGSRLRRLVGRAK